MRTYAQAKEFAQQQHRTGGGTVGEGDGSGVGLVVVVEHAAIASTRKGA